MNENGHGGPKGGGLPQWKIDLIHEGFVAGDRLTKIAQDVSVSYDSVIKYTRNLSRPKPLPPMEAIEITKLMMNWR